MEQKLSNVLNVSYSKFAKEHKNVLNQGDLQSIAKFIEMINNNYPDKIVDDKQTEYLYKGFEIEGVSHNFNPAEKEIKSFLFETEDEAKFVNQMWKLCKNEININHFQHLIPIVFRMLKLFKSKWSDSITTTKTQN